MKKHIRILLFLLLLPMVNYAQLRTVIFDGERSLFDGGNSLPAEEMFFITGGIRPDIELVEVELYKGNFGKKLYTSRWERPFGSTTETFQALFKYKLAGSSEYDVKVNYFRPVTEKEKVALDSAINSALSEYINQAVGKENRLIKPADRLVDDLNNIVKQGMSLYRSKTLNEFEGFSDIIRAKFRALESGDARRAAGAGASDDKPGNGRGAAANAPRSPRAGAMSAVLDDIKRLCKGEVKQLVSADLTVLIMTKEIDRYPTENTMNPVALNVGYGGAYISGNAANLNYGQSPFVGLSFPLSSVGTAPAFLRNTSVSAGVFTKNFLTAGDTVSGPIVGRPYYLGVGYRVLSVVRINAGAAVLEREINSQKQVTFSPMVGLSFEVGLWLGLRKR